MLTSLQEGLTRWNFLVFISLSAGIFVFHCASALLVQYFFIVSNSRYGTFLTAVEFGCYFFFACGERVFQLGFREAIVLNFRWEYLVLGIAQSVSHGLGNISLQYLDFPTKVVFKSCKLLMVLVGSRIIFQESQTLRDYLSAGLVCFGLIIFTLADKATSPRFQIYGVVLILLSLVGEVFLSTLTERAMLAPVSYQRSSPVLNPTSASSSSSTSSSSPSADQDNTNQNSPNTDISQETSANDDPAFSQAKEAVQNEQFNRRTELLIYEYLIASSFVTLLASIFGDFGQAIEFFYGVSPVIKFVVPVYATVTYLGVCCAIAIVSRYGSVAVTYVTSCRKMFSLAISFLFFPKTILSGHLLGFFFVGAGILSLDIAKDQQRKAARDRAFIQEKMDQPEGDVV